MVSSRFSDLERILGCPRNLLAERLRKLVEDGILTTETYQETGARSRLRYRPRHRLDLDKDELSELTPRLAQLGPGWEFAMSTVSVRGRAGARPVPGIPARPGAMVAVRTPHLARPDAEDLRGERPRLDAGTGSRSAGTR